MNIVYILLYGITFCCITVTSKERTVLAQRGSDVRQSAAKVIKEINILSAKESETEKETGTRKKTQDASLIKKKNLLTMVQFDTGMFPWQLGNY